MPIPGYDIDDLDENLRERLAQKALEDMLDDEELARLEAGESLTEVLDSDEIEQLLEEDTASAD
ncbi:hypothetical protein [Haloarchaeobius sp. HRN-SO-5]|uniref:hypothetical protein n=1 Tax=Haloarchaeobius sp. HRN-SO-5 TaxID=3446118 RepID=UPI003EB7484C